MAITIKGIPILKDKTASEFVRKTERATSRKGSVNFKEQYRSSVSILKKANI
ncbi:hypothetical protein [Proteiniphilum sp.]|uniref:hypothetical protein n=1 Tax=Proteiniphilum sp. TaxID=1926877 RepID=UPI00332935CB